MSGCLIRAANSFDGIHLKLFLDTKEVLQNLNRTVRAKQIKADYRRQITDTKNRMERAQSMNSNLYNDYAGGQDFAKVMERYAGFEELEVWMWHLRT